MCRNLTEELKGTNEGNIINNYELIYCFLWIEFGQIFVDLVVYRWSSNWKTIV